MHNNQKRYDLEDRTKMFALNVRRLISKLPKTNSNHEDIKQVVRTSGSVAANYIEASEAVSKKDFYYRIKICRKEAKESILFLALLDTDNNSQANFDREELIRETTELMKIFGSIVSKAEKQS